MVNINESYITTKAPPYENTTDTKLKLTKKNFYEVTEQRIKYGAKCWTLSFPMSVAKLGIRKIRIFKYVMMFEIALWNEEKLNNNYLCLFSNAAIEYRLHMKDQFKYVYVLKRPLRSLAGSVVQVSVREIQMQPYTKSNCLLPHHCSDEYWYKRMEDMDNCTVPWTINNTNICLDNLDIARVIAKDWVNEVRIETESIQVIFW